MAPHVSRSVTTCNFIPPQVEQSMWLVDPYVVTETVFQDPAGKFSVPDSKHPTEPHGAHSLGKAS